MALTRLGTGIQPEDHNTFRLYKAHRGPARCVMLAILKWGCKKAPEVTFEEYLLQNLGYSNKRYRTVFDGSQREKLRHHTSGDEFDISLLYKIIQNTCAGVALASDSVWTSEDFSRLECLVNYIKKSRNNLAHNDHEISNQEIVRRLEKLRDILIITLKVGRDLYCVQHAEADTFINQVSEAITAIREHPFAQTDVLQYQNDLLFEDLREIMSTDGAKEVAKIFSRNNLLNLNPVSFINGSDYHLKVDRVFIDIQMVLVESGVQKAIDYRDILVYSHDTRIYADNHSINSSQQSVREKPVIQLVEGNPGTGKTTLLKFMMSDWKKQTNIIKDLADFQLVLYFECRNPYKDSLADYLVSQMPLTSTRFHKSDLVRCLLGLKVLLLIDGLDELNSASKRFFKEILHVKKNSDISVLCTTRSEKVTEISRMIPSDLTINYFKLLGIPDNKRGKFVELYHEELKKRGMSAENTNSIVQYVENAPPQLNDFFVYPLNLVLFTYLWATRPASINSVTSVTVLYMEVHSLVVEKLHRRLLDDPDVDYIPSEEIKGKCEQFLDVLYQLSFVTLSYNMIYLEQEHVNMLLDVCRETGLAIRHIMSSFLVVELTSSGERYVERHRFPHKGIQEFYGAHHILSIISNENLAKHKDQVLKALEESLRKFHISSYDRQEIKAWASELSERKRIRTLLEKTCPVRYQEKGKYTNLLQHLVGLLLYHTSCLFTHYAEQIIELLNDSGDLSFDQWIDLLKQTDYDALVTKEVAKFACQRSWTVYDDQERAAGDLIAHCCPEVLSVELYKEPKHLSHLADLLRSAFAKGCEIHLHLHSLWRDPKDRSSDGISAELKRISLSEAQEWGNYRGTASKKNLTRFTGHAANTESLAGFVASIEELRVVIRSDDEALDWCVNINTYDVFVRLMWVGLHVAGAGVDPDLLSPLPSLGRCPHLYLSGVGDGEVEWASRAARALQPLRSEYGVIGFPKSSLTSKGMEVLAKRFFEKKVKVREVFVASCDLEVEVIDLFSTIVGCQVVRCQEAEIWTRGPTPPTWTRGTTPPTWTRGPTSNKAEYEDYISLTTMGDEAGQKEEPSRYVQKQATVREPEGESHLYEVISEYDRDGGNGVEESLYEAVSYGQLPMPSAPEAMANKPAPPFSTRPRQPLPTEYHNSSAKPTPRPQVPIPNELPFDPPSVSSPEKNFPFPPKPLLKPPAKTLPSMPLRPPLNPPSKTPQSRPPKPPMPLPSKPQEAPPLESRSKPPRRRAKVATPSRAQAPSLPQPVMYPAVVYPWSLTQQPCTVQLPQHTWPLMLDQQWTPWGVPLQRPIPMAFLSQPSNIWSMPWGLPAGLPSTLPQPVVQPHGVQIPSAESTSSELGIHSDQSHEEKYGT
ncbi:uncharacterized protein LOC122267538 isoform X2 [Penaeus japonicus]|uniref:uncharacterized protein LOC122267538 isoform X2 n=1 Tax=Penaeus japonicus TaxID=27405 RepID=UPI001C715F16|nr:uncharacterized protein LOC122267538 isoform X2 [Penaeus japonicus]